MLFTVKGTGVAKRSVPFSFYSVNSRVTSLVLFVKKLWALFLRHTFPHMSKDYTGLLMIAYKYPPVKAIGSLRNYNVSLAFSSFFDSVQVVTTANRRVLPRQELPEKNEVAIHVARTLDTKTIWQWVNGHKRPSSVSVKRNQVRPCCRQINLAVTTTSLLRYFATSLLSPQRRYFILSFPSIKKMFPMKKIR